MLTGSAEGLSGQMLEEKVAFQIQHGIGGGPAAVTSITTALPGPCCCRSVTGEIHAPAVQELVF